MRKNWFLSWNKEEAILTLAQRYDNQPPKERKFFPGKDARCRMSDVSEEAARQTCR